MTTVTRSVKDRHIEAHPERCNGCLLCQLRCSYRFEKRFNPLRAAITVDPFHQGGLGYAMGFDDRCDACGLWAQVCQYDALSWTKERSRTQ
jgi:ferredoxin